MEEAKGSVGASTMLQLKKGFCVFAKAVKWLRTSKYTFCYLSFVCLMTSTPDGWGCEMQQGETSAPEKRPPNYAVKASHTVWWCIGRQWTIVQKCLISSVRHSLHSAKKHDVGRDMKADGWKDDRKNKCSVGAKHCIQSIHFCMLSLSL